MSRLTELLLALALTLAPTFTLGVQEGPHVARVVPSLLHTSSPSPLVRVLALTRTLRTLVLTRALAIPCKCERVPWTVEETLDAPGLALETSGSSCHASWHHQ